MHAFKKKKIRLRLVLQVSCVKFLLSKLFLLNRDTLQGDVETVYGHFCSTRVTKHAYKLTKRKVHHLSTEQISSFLQNCHCSSKSNQTQMQPCESEISIQT